MKKILTTAAAAALAASLLTACGGQQAASTTPASGSQNAQSSTEAGAEATPAPAATDAVKDCTWRSEGTDVSFDIDFREYPKRSAGQGYIENINDIALAVGAADKVTPMVYGVDASQFTDPTQVPEGLNPCILEILSGSAWNGGFTDGENDRAVAFDKIESAGSENGYEVCRFEGNYTFTANIDREEHSFALVGYTVLLKQSGYPLYVIAADMSDDQANTGSLDKIAHDCIASLRETA